MAKMTDKKPAKAKAKVKVSAATRAKKAAAAAAAAHAKATATATLVPAVRQQYPNLTVEIVSVPAGDAYLDKYTAMQAGGTPPELFSAYGTGFPDYYFIGGVADLSGFVARDKIDLSTYLPQVKDVIDTIYQESFDGGLTWTAPLKVNREPSNTWWGAFSRNGTFEGAHNQIASAGGYTYVVRCQGHKDGTQPLVPNPNGSNTLVLTEAGKGHQHQSNWVALVQNRK